MRTTNQTAIKAEARTAVEALRFCTLRFCIHPDCRVHLSRQLTARGMIYDAILAHDWIVCCQRQSEASP